MARQNGKIILFGDIHAAMPEAELRRRQALMDEALGAAADDPGKVVVLAGDALGGPFIPVEDPADDAITAFARIVIERLRFFLEMIDACDVEFLDRTGDRLTFLVCADREEHLQLIRNAIAGERRMLDDLGIDPHDVEVQHDAIRIFARVPDPAADGLAS